MSEPDAFDQLKEALGADRVHIEATDKPWIRSNHHHAFRSGQWARILTIAPGADDRDCYVVEFPDGKTDFWVVDDPSAEYEFASERRGP